MKFIFFTLPFIFSLAHGYEGLEHSLNKACNHKIVVCTMQKTGSHLLTKALHLITGKMKTHVSVKNWNNNFFWIHPANGNFDKYLNSQYKTFTIYRDPREHLVSIIRRKDWGTNVYTPPSDLATFQNRLTRLITNFNTGFKSLFKGHGCGGTIASPTINGIWSPYLNKLNNPYLCAVKFENLVGPSGGATLEDQIHEINKIATHLNLELTEEELEHVAKHMYGGTHTFVAGKNNSWEEYYTEEHKRLFKQSGGATLIRLGYEIDSNW